MYTALGCVFKSALLNVVSFLNSWKLPSFCELAL